MNDSIFFAVCLNFFVPNSPFLALHCCEGGNEIMLCQNEESDQI